MFHRSVFLTVVALGLGCSSTRSNEPTTPAPPPTEVDANVSMMSNDPSMEADAAVTPPEPAMGPVAIERGERREVPTPNPTVRITAPANNRTITDNRVEVRLAVQNWRDVNNADDHRHIHLVLDNEPYRRIDDPTRPITLENLTPGRHVLRAFPGWETHETVKTPGAYAMVVFNVGRPAPGAGGFNARDPLLTYSRPKGAVNGADAERILLDWYLSGIPDGRFGAEGYRVRPRIDGNDMEPLTAWVPHYIVNLPDGEHTIGLTLLNPEGQPVPGPFNSVEQRITVNRHPPPPAADAGAPDPHAGH
ncbi:MAG: hypothetical protein R3A52_14870 [Polyangiales bacterium]